MTEIEQKALALVSEVLGVRLSLFERSDSHIHEALCRAIEQHEAFRQKVSDALVEYFGPKDLDVILAGHLLECFIIPKPTVDPLVEALAELDWSDKYAERLREALAKRGLKIVETGQ